MDTTGSGGASSGASLTGRKAGRLHAAPRLSPRSGWNCGSSGKMELRNSRKSELRQFQKCGVDTIPRRSKGKNADGREPGREESIAAYGPKGGHATADGGSSGLQPPDRGRSTHPPRTGRMEIAASTGGHGGARPDPCDNGSHLTRQGHRQHLTATIAVPAGRCLFCFHSALSRRSMRPANLP